MATRQTQSYCKYCKKKTLHSKEMTGGCIPLLVLVFFIFFIPIEIFLIFVLPIFLLIIVIEFLRSYRCQTCGLKPHISFSVIVLGIIVAIPITLYFVNPTFLKNITEKIKGGQKEELKLNNQTKQPSKENSENQTKQPAKENTEIEIPKNDPNSWESKAIVALENMPETIKKELGSAIIEKIKKLHSSLRFCAIKSIKTQDNNKTIICNIEIEFEYGMNEKKTTLYTLEWKFDNLEHKSASITCKEGFLKVNQSIQNEINTLYKEYYGRLKNVVVGKNW